MKTNWIALIGGIIIVMVAAAVLVPLSFLFGLGTESVAGFWLVATFAPVILLAGAALLLRLASRDLGKGMLIGVCVVFLIAGLCNWQATEGGRKLPRIAG